MLRLRMDLRVVSAVAGSVAGLLDGFCPLEIAAGLVCGPSSHGIVRQRGRARPQGDSD